jgi:hypothetical protein
MTLVLSVRSQNSLWLVSDRRLSYGGQRPPTDTAVKVMSLETLDGVGLLGYAGLGATPRGTQPSDWMSAVLRGRGGQTFEQALQTLSNVAARELPRYLARTPAGAHFIIIPAFVRGLGPRVYSIDNVIDRDTGSHRCRFTNYQQTGTPGSPVPRVAVAGTGGMYLASRRRTWQRDLLRIVNAHDRGKLSDRVIADRLAELNWEAHRGVRDGSVGPRCIVAWRRRADARPGLPGGGQEFYTGTRRDGDAAAIPTISNGLDVQGIAGTLMDAVQPWLASLNSGESAGFEFDDDEINARLAELPDEPDDWLR